ncbi:hypothetical protein [Corynebacterium callunae]|uniref:hypothetical protein n=1 Tax=Corynebacterium callunae TaxID=1721 RepID=UPI001FFE3A32|nr:hypothetical protein [Corynebacterium callunae]MCK2200520.1 hypothetical protein [Corynebacterium callunae]
MDWETINWGVATDAGALLIGLGGFIYAGLAHKRAKEANMLAKDAVVAAKKANLIAEQANDLAGDSNTISQRALDISAESVEYEFTLNIDEQRGAIIVNHNPLPVSDVSVFVLSEGRAVANIEGESAEPFGEIALSLTSLIDETIERAKKMNFRIVSEGPYGDSKRSGRHPVTCTVTATVGYRTQSGKQLSTKLDDTFGVVEDSHGQIRFFKS